MKYIKVGGGDENLLNPEYFTDSSWSLILVPSLRSVIAGGGGGGYCPPPDPHTLQHYR
jgi:hypothetical protein